MRDSDKCVIIGAGASVNKWDFNLDGLDAIVINWCPLQIPIKYVVWYDNKVGEWIQTYSPYSTYTTILSNTRHKLGLLNEETWDFYENPATDYTIKSGGTHCGIYALQIAEVIGYKEALLVGFDFKPTNSGNTNYYCERGRWCDYANFERLKGMLEFLDNNPYHVSETKHKHKYLYKAGKSQYKRFNWAIRYTFI